jgi:DNA-binding transcriptional regulator PaaX
VQSDPRDVTFAAYRTSGATALVEAAEIAAELGRSDSEIDVPLTEVVAEGQLIRAQHPATERLSFRLTTAGHASRLGRLVHVQERKHEASQDRR